MSQIHYKFKSSKDYDSATFDGHSISVFDLKREILIAKGLKGPDDLALTHAESGEEYYDDATLIPRNTSILVARVPARSGRGGAQRYLEGSGPVPRGGGMTRNVFDRSGQNNNQDFSGAKVYRNTTTLVTEDGPPAPPLDLSNLSEEDKMKLVFQQGATNWDKTQEAMASAPYRPLSKFQGATRAPPPGGHKPGAGPPGSTPGSAPGSHYNRPAPDQQQRPPPTTYVCYRCGKKGEHWIQFCPTNNDKNFEPIGIKKTTGIPRSFLKTVESDVLQSKKGVMVTQDGNLVVAQTNDSAWKKYHEKSKATLASDDAYATAPVPDDMKCPICSMLLKSAVQAPCCLTNFCDECIRNHLVQPPKGEEPFKCHNCHRDLVPDQLMPNINLRQRVEQHLRDWAKNRRSEAENATPNPNSRGGSPAAPDQARGGPSTGQDSPAVPKREESSGPADDDRAVAGMKRRASNDQLSGPVNGDQDRDPSWKNKKPHVNNFNNNHNGNNFNRNRGPMQGPGGPMDGPNRMMMPDGMPRELFEMMQRDPAMFMDPAFFAANGMPPPFMMPPGFVPPFGPEFGMQGGPGPEFWGMGRGIPGLPPMGPGFPPPRIGFGDNNNNNNNNFNGAGRGRGRGDWQGNNNHMNHMNNNMNNNLNNNMNNSINNNMNNMNNNMNNFGGMGRGRGQSPNPGFGGGGGGRPNPNMAPHNAPAQGGRPSGHHNPVEGGDHGESVSSTVTSIPGRFDDDLDMDQVPTGPRGGVRRPSSDDEEIPTGPRGRVNDDFKQDPSRRSESPPKAPRADRSRYRSRSGTRSDHAESHERGHRRESADRGRDHHHDRDRDHREGSSRDREHERSSSSRHDREHERDDRREDRRDDRRDGSSRRESGRDDRRDERKDDRRDERRSDRREGRRDERREDSRRDRDDRKEDRRDERRSSVTESDKASSGRFHNERTTFSSSSGTQHRSHRSENRRGGGGDYSDAQESDGEQTSRTSRGGGREVSLSSLRQRSLDPQKDYELKRQASLGVQVRVRGSGGSKGGRGGEGQDDPVEEVVSFRDRSGSRRSDDRGDSRQRETSFENVEQINFRNKGQGHRGSGSSGGGGGGGEGGQDLVVMGLVSSSARERERRERERRFRD